MGLFGAESPAYVGPGQNPAGSRGSLFGIFPSTPQYEQPSAPAQTPTQPNGKTIQIRIAMPGVLAFECALTPEMVAALTSMVALAVRNVADVVAQKKPANDEAPAAPSESEDEQERVSETEQRVWERE